MTTIYTDSVWPWVQPHQWKHMARTAPITGILWHCTRGGQWYDGNIELGAYLNWCKSPNNRVAYAGGDYAGIASYGIGPGRIVECVPDDRIPRYSSWPSDRTKLSVEVAQSNPGQPIEAATIEACVRYAKAKAEEYGFPLTRVFPVNDDDWTGMSGHEDTVQGKASGKSDPGPEFWVPFMAALEEESMTPEERAKLDAVYAALTGGVPGVIEKWNENGNSVLVAYTDLVFPHLNHGTTTAPEEPRVRTIKGTIEGTITE